MSKFVESNLNPLYRVFVTHLHIGNTSNGKRHGKPYVTIAEVARKVPTTDGPVAWEVLGQGVARCSKLDSPRRSVGRAIAVGRAMRSASTAVADVVRLTS